MRGLKEITLKDGEYFIHTFRDVEEELKAYLQTHQTIQVGEYTLHNKGMTSRNYTTAWSRGSSYIVLCNDVSLNIENENVEVLSDVNLLDKYIKSDEENFVIGGATIYRLLLPKASKLYITKINESFEGDVYFPEIDLDDWKVVSKEKGKKDEKNPYDYEYINFERK